MKRREGWFKILQPSDFRNVSDAAALTTRKLPKDSKPEAASDIPHGENSRKSTTNSVLPFQMSGA